MELRFVHGDFGNIKYKLQYREPFNDKNMDWKDVPCVESKEPDIAPHECRIPWGKTVCSICSRPFPEKEKSIMDKCLELVAEEELANKPANNKLVTKSDELVIGSKVRKVGGDYRFEGTIVSAFKKLSGKERFVVEDDRGVLHIYSEKNLVIDKPDYDCFGAGKYIDDSYQ
jgi:predicted nucleic acid-binding Zn ribbon protein